MTNDRVHFAGDADGLIGSPDIAVTNVTAGIITATKFAGDGSELTGVSSESLDVLLGQNLLEILLVDLETLH